MPLVFFSFVCILLISTPLKYLCAERMLKMKFAYVATEHRGYNFKEKEPLFTISIAEIENPAVTFPRNEKGEKVPLQHEDQISITYMDKDKVIKSFMSKRNVTFFIESNDGVNPSEASFDQTISKLLKVGNKLDVFETDNDGHIRVCRSHQKGKW